uniref:tyrosine-type recombinase/integrase n=1 Tax=Metasolibacillus sp. FSL K6-0083 TaxID=2921416 RepID=UPI00406BE529
MLEAKLVDEDGSPKISLHGLRHTHATILLNNGQNVKVIAERLGNTPNMVMNTYGHVMKELEQESVTVFSASLATGAKSGANYFYPSPTFDISILSRLLMLYYFHIRNKRRLSFYESFREIRCLFCRAS